MEYASAEMILYRLINYWGMLVRFIWYCVFGLFSYSLMEPKNIFTLGIDNIKTRDVFINVIFAVVAISLLRLFFNFPVAKVATEHSNRSEVYELYELKNSPYLRWAWFSVFTAAGLVIFSKL